MDKHEATDFILSRLELGYGRTEIIDDLSQLLKAPPAVVTKFVDQVAATFTPTPPAQPSPQSVRDDIPSWIAELESQGHPSTFIEADPPAQPKTETRTVYPGPPPSVYESTPPSPPISLSPAEKNLISPPKKEIDTEELTVYVLQELKRQRRLNDIVETVCQRTGWHWNEAQRFVAKARTSHHGEISKSQSRFMIPFSIVFILGGAALLIWAVTALVDYYLGFTSPDRTNTLAVDFLPVVIGALVTSFGVIAGGIYGLYRTLSSR